MMKTNPAISCAIALSLSTLLMALHPVSTTAAQTLQAGRGIARQPILAPTESSKSMLMAGIQFNEQLLPAPNPVHQWYRIPSWFAGTWHRDTVTTVSHHDLKSGVKSSAHHTRTARSEDNEGWQRDAEGEYWHFDHTPFRSESLGEGCRQIFVVTGIRVLEASTDQVVKEFEGTGVVVDDLSGFIKYSAKARSTQTYSLKKPGCMVANSVTTEYDSHGQPVLMSTTITTYRQVAEFRSQDLYEGKDMRVAFKDFLTSQGKSRLIPAELTIDSKPLSDSNESAHLCLDETPGSASPVVAHNPPIGVAIDHSNK